MSNKKFALPLLIFSTFAIMLPNLKLSAEAVKAASDTVVLRILNSEDYIYLNTPEDGYDNEDMVVQFENHMKEDFDMDVKVVYETSDTNESIYNDLLSGRTTYDLVNTSDYMCQKFAREGLTTKIDRSLIPNYDDYGSKTIKDRLDNIEVKMPDGSVEYLKDYSVGYMWGTMGLLFNPTYEKFPEDCDPLNDMKSFDALWSDTYRGTTTIKDSMRDTLAVAIVHYYEDKFQEYKYQYELGEIDAEEYNAKLSYYFNIISNATDDELDNELEGIKGSLNSLRKNIFGMEVDSGKQDMVTGKIGINLAWSGDAVYSMDQAQDEKELELYYSLPESGSNVWFDAWSIPKNDKRDQTTYKVACEFLNFISDPVNASQNMDYTGYTSFIGGDDILDLARDWYDIRTDLIYAIDEEENYYSLYYVDPFTLEETEVWYDDVHYEEDSDADYDEVELYYYEDEEDEEAEPIPYGYYNEDLLMDPEWVEVDLSYFFNDTLTEYENDYDTVFYTDYYTEDNGCVGRQFFCQYPDEETVVRCCVMDDYGERNTMVLKMWESFKGNSLPTWAIILLIVEVCLIAGVIIFFIQAKYIKKALRKKRTAL